MANPSPLAPLPHAPADAELASARRVIGMEMDGLSALRDALDGSFRRAVEVLTAVSGRVIVTGIGKSGHVAVKIAGTFASTGTRAQFVHPAEAGHGDLGMIGAEDAVLAISNSGETTELAVIVGYAKRFAIPLVVVTRRPASTLGEAADVVLALPAVPEACPMGLAPTTSTTMAMALGDALAVALLERRGFSPTDFHVFHPGGQLGRNLLRVAEVMHTGDAVPLCALGTDMSEAILVMTAKTFGCVGVTDADGRLAGIVTDGDLRRHMGPDLIAASVDAVMSRRPKTIRPRALAAEALGFMNAHKITSLFVLDEAARPIGIVRMHDVLKAGVA